MKKIIIPISFLLISIAASAQGIKSNIANVGDPRVLFSSPAAIAMQHTVQMVAGYEFYYSGLGGHGLQNGFAGFAYPHHVLGAFALNAQYFTSEIYRTGNLSFGYSRALYNQKVGFGLDFGVLCFAYDQDKFRLLDWNDPVFANGTSKSVVDVGLSALANPIKSLYIGIAVKHLNQPNISLVGDDVRLPLKLQSGIVFKNSFISPLISLEYFDKKFDVDLGLERWLFDHRAMLRANYFRYNLGAVVGFIVPLQKNWLRFEYEYRYPLSELSDVVSASHLLLLSYSFSSQPGDFELIIRSPKQRIQKGESARYLIDMKRIGGFDDPINLMVSGPDKDFDLSLIPETLNGAKPAVLSLTPSDNCEPGDYRFDIKARSKDKEKVFPILLEIKKRPALFADVQALVDKLVIKETTRIHSRDPLLPYIFFEENQSYLNAERYNILNPDRSPVKNFIFYPERLLDMPSKYRNTLNIIGRRLWDHPEMEIIVQGYISDWGVEKDNLELSRRRAETVRDYLVENCGVRPGQITTEAHELPPDPASNLDPRGRQENQRVEITCPIASQPILDPIVTETSEIATFDPLCNFQIKNVIAEAGLKKWQLIIIEAPNDTFKIIDGKTLAEKAVTWNWKNDAGQSVMVDKIYRYQLSLCDNLNQTYTTDWKSVQVEKVSKIEREYIQKNIEKTRLILFKYDRADMDLTSKSLQEELDLNVQKFKASPQATLLIQGHTDVIGDTDYNLKLSLRRAESVAQYFMDRGISKARITYEGFGMTRPLMSNELPEGRMMNRRVEIYILYKEF